MTENLELTATYLCIVGKSPEMKKVFLDKNGYHYDFPTPEIAYNLLKSENKHIKTDLRNVKAKSNCFDIHIERVQIWFSSERDNKHIPNLKYDYARFCYHYKGRSGKIQLLVERGLSQEKRKLAQGCLDEYERRMSETYIYHAKRYLKEYFYKKT